MAPSHKTDSKASFQGIDVARLNNVIGSINTELKTSDQPIRTSLLVLCEYFCIKTLEKE